MVHNIRINYALIAFDDQFFVVVIYYFQQYYPILVHKIFLPSLRINRYNYLIFDILSKLCKSYNSTCSSSNLCNAREELINA